jgi:arabinofuranosyltransferase
MFPKKQLFGVCLGAAVAITTYYGWKLFLFTTDDAYIAFRYASNSLAGHGLTWNAPPFRPVEGYTSFLWVTLLREVWRLFGVEPPEAANYLSLLFGYATLYLGYRFIARMNLPAPLASARWVLLVLVMVGTLTNRTFLTWLSSGLETSLFNFLFTWWVYEGTASTERRTGLWASRLSLSATLTALARPDGMLLVLGTPLILCAAAAGPIMSATGVGPRLRQLLLGLRGAWPLLGIPLHLVWRRVTYGDWLPNTYYAKHVAPWPESGARYLASFVVEYGIVIWIVLALAVLIVASASWWTNIKEWTQEPAQRREAVWLLIERSPPVIAVAIVLAHFGYYTFDIGGDHFEYRVYSHLVLLIFVSAVWLLGRLATYLPESRPLRPWMAVGVLLLFIACAQPIPWTHWSKTHDLETRPETFRLIQPIASSFPKGVRPIVEKWDGWQEWLIAHSVCMRHQEHKVFGISQRDLLPERGETDLRSQSLGEPVIAFGLTGMLGWVFPDVAVIDTLGLNDHVVARNTDLRAPRGDPRAREGRQMAHDRKPPPGYLQCFRPNFGVDLRSGIFAYPRAQALTERDIIACEDRFWQ